jgi:hypothetical protein
MSTENHDNKVDCEEEDFRRHRYYWQYLMYDPSQPCMDEVMDEEEEDDNTNNETGERNRTTDGEYGGDGGDGNLTTDGWGGNETTDGGHGNRTTNARDGNWTTNGGDGNRTTDVGASNLDHRWNPIDEDTKFQAPK